MMTISYHAQKRQMVARRMEPHLRRNNADMDKLLKMLSLHDVAFPSVAQGTDVKQQPKASAESCMEAISTEERAIWHEFESKESYEARVAHAILQMSEQIVL